jgi:chemotaxis family two-component system response regulator Rcp1
MAKRPEILLVEDNPGDACLTSSALNRDSHPCNIILATDGVKALALLRERCDQGKTPDLILLDLNLPRKDGRAVLSEVKADLGLRKIPVVVFSTSGAARDIVICYELGANCYVRKAGNLADFLTAAEAISALWLGPACLPGNPEKINSDSPHGLRSLLQLTDVSPPC